MEKISIIGLGWLGLPLAKHLQARDKQVQGSKSSSEGVEALKDAGIDCQLFNTTLDLSLRKSRIKALFSCDAFIITLPPNGHHGHDKYPSIISALAKSAEYCGAKRIIFTSSISVYGKQSKIMTEETSCEPATAAGKALVKAEDALLKAVKIPVTIVRLGGLLGDDRLPQNWMQKMKSFERPNHSVNLVHRDDVINAITAIIERDWQGNQLFNIVSPLHPTRYEYYHRIAVDHRLPLPNFSTEELNSVSKAGYVDGSKIMEVLPFQYAHSIFV